MNKEVWKAIEGTGDRILISNYGNVRSLLRDDRILKCQPDKKGYLRLSVTVDRVKHTYKVHREVAKAFIDNPDELPQVNHKDGDKKNNRSDNLEWTTNKQNAEHAIDNGLWGNVFAASSRTNEARKIPVVLTSIKTGEKIECESISEAQRITGSKKVHLVLKGERSQTMGYYVSHAEGGGYSAAKA